MSSKPTDLFMGEAISDPVTLRDPQTGEPLEFAFRDITPSVAHRLMSVNFDKNRNLKPRAITQYAGAIRAGLFRAGNGESIKIDSLGRLIDGQHRLEGVIEAKTSQIMLVIRGIHPDNLLSLDTGARRTLADAMKIHGTGAGARITSVASAIRALDHLALAESLGFSYMGLARSKKRVKSNEELVLFWEQQPDFIEATERFHKHFKYRLIERTMPLSSAIVMYHLCHPVNPEAAYSVLKTFENQGVSFEGMGVKCPTTVVYQDIARRRLDRVKLTFDDYARAFLWAFDHLTEGTTGKYRRETAGSIFGKSPHREAITKKLAEVRELSAKISGA